MWGGHIHQCQRVRKLDGVQASEQIMRFGEAGGQVRARQSQPLAGAGESGHGMSCEDGEAAAGGGLLAGRCWFERDREPADLERAGGARDGLSGIWTPRFYPGDFLHFTEKNAEPNGPSSARAGGYRFYMMIYLHAGI